MWSTGASGWWWGVCAFAHSLSSSSLCPSKKLTNRLLRAMLRTAKKRLQKWVAVAMASGLLGNGNGKWKEREREGVVECERWDARGAGGAILSLSCEGRPAPERLPLNAGSRR